ncbi:hypothetical protein QNM97_22810 [Gordonia sp. L191]|uniref:hypothetical protein n=1 Tax=Gordonia sp. L191 TaxID=2982699 RepID=UPI0024BF349C|nr:hypothetical protein [Gordonia sp. L191]WHU46766.1 hypothetical protein QNM97_22810 [Gordonia sp. L191]
MDHQSPPFPDSARHHPSRPDYGPAHRSRADIAAALLWDPTGNDARAAERFITHLGESELVLAVRPAWLRPHGWGLFVVTTDRVLYVPHDDSDDVLELPIEVVLWLLEAADTNEHGHHKANLIDLERNVTLWFEGPTSITAINIAISWAARQHTAVQSGYEPANTGNVVEEFSRFAALLRARETGALDDEAMRGAIARMFGVAPPPS